MEKNTKKQENTEKEFALVNTLIEFMQHGPGRYAAILCLRNAFKKVAQESQDKGLISSAKTEFATAEAFENVLDVLIQSIVDEGKKGV